jgi:hypothetical protein
MPDPGDEDAVRIDLVADHRVRAAERDDQLADALADRAPPIGEVGQALEVILQDFDQSQGGVPVLLEQPVMQAFDIAPGRLREVNRARQATRAFSDKCETVIGSKML